MLGEFVRRHRDDLIDGQHLGRGAGEHFAVQMAAAQREIAMAPPLREHARGPEEQTAMLRRVAARVFAAAQPVCQARNGGEGCGFRVAYDPSSARLLDEVHATGEGLSARYFPVRNPLARA